MVPDPLTQLGPLTSLAPLAREALRRYRGTGADVPFGNPLTAHGVPVERYLWRFTDRDGQRTLIALNVVTKEGRGASATLRLAASDGFLRTAVHPAAEAASGRLGAFAGSAFAGTSDRVVVDLGGDAKLDAAVRRPVLWPRRGTVGSSLLHVVPGLPRYWHPWLLAGEVTGTAVLGGHTWRLDGWTVYAEKSWGRGPAPGAWWWGQAHGFGDPGACVAFAGGSVAVGPVRTTVSGVVVRLPDGRVLRLGDPVLTPVSAKVTDDWWLLRGRSAQWHVELDGFAGPAYDPADRVPDADHGAPGARRHLRGTLRVRVRHRGRLVWAGESRTAVLEASVGTSRRGADRRTP